MENRKWLLRLLGFVLVVAGVLSFFAYSAKAAVNDYTTPGTTTFKAVIPGAYTFELWGAQGGGNSSTAGKGGYVKGTKVLNVGDTVTIVVGGTGTTGSGTGKNVGGGYTKVYLNGTAVSNEIATAAGGGGGPNGGAGGSGTGAGGASVGSGAGTAGTLGGGGGSSYDYSYATGYYQSTGYYEDVYSRQVVGTYPGNCNDAGYGICYEYATVKTGTRWVSTGSYWVSTGTATTSGNPGQGGSNSNGASGMTGYTSQSGVQAGNGKVSMTIPVIPPGVALTYSGSGWTNQDQSISVVASAGSFAVDAVQGPDGVWKTGTTMTYPITSNGTYTFNARTTDGTIGTASYTVSNIDKSLPTATLTQVPNALDGTVMLTLSSIADTGSGVASIKKPDDSVVAGATSTTFKATTNGSHRFVVRDNAGNENTFTINVTAVDNIAPTGLIVADKTTWTNGNVVLTVSGIVDTGGSGYKNLKMPDGSTVTTTTGTYTVTSNGTYNFVLTDNVGNARTLTYTVSNIDKVAPTADLVSLSPNWTNGDVTLRLQSMGDVGSGLSKVKLPSSLLQTLTGTMVDYTVTTNGTYSFDLIDLAGNVTTKTLVVTNIDKTVPNIPTLSLSTEAWSKPGVTLNVVSNGDVTGGSGIDRLEYRLNGGAWQKFTGVVTIPDSYTEDVKVEARAIDNVGLISDLMTKTAKIDASLPVISDFGIVDVNGRQELKVSAFDGQSGLNGLAYQFYRKEVGTDADFVKVAGTWSGGNSIVLPTMPSNTKYVYKVQVRDLVSNVATSDEVVYVSPVSLEFGGVKAGDNPNAVTFDLLKSLGANDETTIEISRGGSVVGRLASGDVYRDAGLDYDRSYTYKLVAYTLVGTKRIESLPLDVTYKIGAPTLEVDAVSGAYTTPFSSKFKVSGMTRLKSGGTVLLSLLDGENVLKNASSVLSSYDAGKWSIEGTYDGKGTKTYDVLLQLKGQELVHFKKIPVTVSLKPLKNSKLGVEELKIYK